MSGYLLKNLLHTQVNAPGANSIILTVPVGHTYLFKNSTSIIVRPAAGIVGFYLEISDTAGANFQQFSPVFLTPAPAGKDFPTGGGGLPENKVLEAGQQIRFNINGAGWTVGSFIQFDYSGADYTI